MIGYRSSLGMVLDMLEASCYKSSGFFGVRILWLDQLIWSRWFTSFPDIVSANNTILL
jgi:hypothetical protein